MCEDIAGGSELSAVVTFSRKIQRTFRWVPDVRWRNQRLEKAYRTN